VGRTTNHIVATASPRTRIMSGTTGLGSLACSRAGAKTVSLMPSTSPSRFPHNSVIDGPVNHAHRRGKYPAKAARVTRVVGLGRCSTHDRARLDEAVPDAADVLTQEHRAWRRYSSSRISLGSGSQAHT
jgi:hypothetical protein